MLQLLQTGENNNHVIYLCRCWSHLSDRKTVIQDNWSLMTEATVTQDRFYCMHLLYQIKQDCHPEEMGDFTYQDPVARLL